MASTYLNKTYSGDGDRRTFTVSVWVKCHAINSNEQSIFCAGDAANQRSELKINGSRKLTFFDYNSSFDAQLETNALLRDANAWYHIVLKYDTTQATSSDRIKLYLNGEEQSLSTSTIPAQNHQSYINLSSKTHRINQSAAGGDIGEYTMAHFHFIDGTAYDASSFGETDATSGIWKPKTSPSVTYGTNGFFLDFANSSDLGNDVSGNNNDFTMSGSGTQTLDTPSNVFSTMNSLVPTASLAFSNGNTTLTGSNDTLFASNNNSTLGVSAGKYYAEVEYDTAGGNTSPTVGVTPITTSATTNTTGSVTDAVVIRMDNDLYVEGATTSAYLGSTPSAGDIIGIALDLDNGKVWFSLNGTFVGDPVAGTGAAFDGITSGEIMCFCTRALGAVFKWNFGNGYFGTTAVSTPESDSAGLGKFEYSVPTGYYALCTKNIADYG